MKCTNCKVTVTKCQRRLIDNKVVNLCKKCASEYDISKHIRRTFPCPLAMKECFNFKNVDIMEGHNGVH